jgi:tetratricopeptide (TPR) repeat protein
MKMDLLDLDGQQLYFDEPMPEKVQHILMQAAAAYGDGKSESLLLRAFLYAPDNLSVLVALYRTYYYQHRLDEAKQVAQRALQVVARRLDFPQDWRLVDLAELSHGVLKSMGLIRFYLLTLKADAYLHLRLGQLEEGRARLRKVAELDASDHFGAGALLDMLARTEKPHLVEGV